MENNHMHSLGNEKLQKWNFYFLYFITFMVGYGQILDTSLGSMGKRPETFLLIPLGLTIYLAIKGKKYKWPITYREKVFAFYALFTSIMPLWAISLERSLDGVSEFWAAALYAILLMFNCRSKSDLTKFIFIFLAGVVLRSGLSIFQYFEGIDNLRASFRHYNVYGNFLLIAISLFFAILIYDSKSPGKKTLCSLSLIIICFTLLATMSRAPVVALLASVLVFSVFVSRKSLVLFLILILTLGLFISLKPDSHISKRIMSVGWHESSLQSRVNYIWPIAIAVYRDHNLILGIGSGSYKTVVHDNAKYKKEFYNPHYGHEHAHVHNDFLAALVAQGLIGASIYVFFIVQVMVIGWKTLKKSYNPFIKSLGAAGFVWIVAHALAGIVHHEYTSSRYNMSVAFIVTVVMLSYYLSNSGAESRDKE